MKNIDLNKNSQTTLTNSTLIFVIREHKEGNVDYIHVTYIRCNQTTKENDSRYECNAGQIELFQRLWCLFQNTRANKELGNITTTEHDRTFHNKDTCLSN